MLRLCDCCMKVFDDENDRDCNMKIYDEIHKYIHSYILCKDCIEDLTFRFDGHHDMNLWIKKRFYSDPKFRESYIESQNNPKKGRKI